IAGSLCVGLLALLVWGLTRPNAYVDGVGVRQDPEWVELRDVVWEKPSHVAPDLNVSEDFYDPTVSPDNLSLVFVKGRPQEGADLWTMDLNGSVWSSPRPIDSLNTEFAETGPDLSAGGEVLYFSSDREGGLGGFDIWFSLKGEDGEWGNPINLGPKVNSAFHEYDPAEHDLSSRLYFSSNRPRRLLTEEEKDAWKGTVRERNFEEGDYDLFSASFADELEDVAGELAFKPAERVHAINTASNEGQAALTARGDFLYFSSDREGGEGGYDLYRSRVFQGEILYPENLGKPVNTTYGDMDPNLAMEGHRLLFSSDRVQDSVRPSGLRHFAIYDTVAREVAPMRLEEETAGGFWTFIDNAKWWILLLLVSIVAIYYLIRQWVQAKHMGEFGLRTRCMVGSILLHVVLALLFSLKELVQEVIEIREATIMEANLEVDALAMEKESLDLREETTELPEVQDLDPLEVTQQLEEPPEFAEAPAETAPAQPLSDAFVVELPSVPLEVAPPENTPERPEQELEKAEVKPLETLALTLPSVRLEQTEPVDTQTEAEFKEFRDSPSETRANTPIKQIPEVAEKSPIREILEN
ncbi:uncharacterized protein METZ01_LOCUS195795, partial [marine metagenome]